MKENHLGSSAKKPVYGCGIDHGDTIFSNFKVSNYSYENLQQILWGLENLNLRKPIFWAEIMAKLRHVGLGPEMVSNLG